MEPTLVIKVKYGDTLRRFSVQFSRDGTPNLDMGFLRAKILNLFKFAADADLTFTYVDEDNDVVTLIDDDDLHDATRQRINPLRINVMQNSSRAGIFDTRSSGSSTPLRSSPSESLPQYSEEVIRAVSEPLCGFLKKLSYDLASKAASSTSAIYVPEPVCEMISKFSHDLASRAEPSVPVSELLENFSKLVLSKPVQVSQSSDAAPSDTKNSHPSSKELKNLFGLEASKEAGLSSNAGALCSPVQQAKIDLNRDISESEFSNGNNSVSEPLTSSDDKGKTVQKECDGYPKGQPIGAGNSASGTVIYPTLSSVIRPVAPMYKYDGFFSGDVNNNRKSFGGASAVVSPHNNCPVSGIMGEGASGVVNNNSLVSGQIGEGAPGVVHDNSPVSGQMDGGASGVVRNNFPVSGQMGEGASGVAPFGGFYRRHLRSNYIHADDSNMGRIFHKGIQCDGCGVHPITGPRYKSKVKVDYDLCSICFSEMGNEAEYTRIDRPKSHRHPLILKGLPIPFGRPHIRNSFTPQGVQQCPMRPYGPKLDSRFIQDVNIVDGTVMAPGTHFTKIWRIRNSGTITWPRGTQLVWIGGDKLTTVDSVQVEIPIEGCFVENELDVAVDFTAPENPGRYMSHWRMALPSGQKFGQCVWVLIQVQVDNSDREAVSGTYRNLNLNLPPECDTGIKGPLIDMNSLPIDCLHPGYHFDMGIELVKPMVVGHPSGDWADSTMDDGIPITKVDSIPVLLKEPVMPVPTVDLAVPSEPSTDVSKLPIPTVEVNAGPSEPSTDVLTSTDELNDGDVMENLLKELYDMGFMQTDLNKEILRMNDYDLEQSLDDLCGYAEWDPMLEELEEMGFCDKETNRKLLIKNGGSIKRVVMDLVAGEKA